jgi:4'-phosphopantetheinyl transferase
VQPGTCDVWWASTDWVRPWHADLLSECERGRRAGLWEQGHRAQYTVAAALLRLVAAPLTGGSAAAVVVDRTCPSCAGSTAGRASPGPACTSRSPTPVRPWPSP